MKTSTTRLVGPAPTAARLFSRAFATGLAVGLVAVAAAADANLMVVVKGQRFKQTGPDFVMLREWDEREEDRPLALEAFVRESASGAVLQGTVQVPGGEVLPLVREETGGTELRTEYQSDELLDLDTRRPDGSYTFTLATQHDGPRSVTVNLSGGAYPPVPRITNYSTLQSLNSAADAVVQWTAFTGGTSNDFVMMSVFGDEGEQVFGSAGPGEPGSLNGTSVQATIPAGTLQAGRTYQAEVMFVKVVGMNASYGMAIAGYQKIVNFSIQTAAQSGTALGAGLARALPPDYQSDVGRDSAVTFRFTRQMNPSFRAVTWSGTGLNPSNFSYQWNDGNRVLWCKYNSALPAGTRIDWSLDLTGFRDAAGFALSGSRSGYFTTTMDAPESPPDVAGYYVVKARGFRQTGPAPVASGMYGCDVAVELAAFNRVREPALLTLGATGTSGKLQPSGWDPAMGIEATFASKTDLDRFFPNGTFIYSLTGVADGTKALTLDLGASDNYPAAPVVTNLTALQTINPAVDTPITWNALDGWSPVMAVGSGFIELEIENDQGNEVVWVDNEELTSGTGFTLPAGTLWPGRTYHVSLAFTYLTDMDGSYGAWGGASGFRSITEFTISTTGSPRMPALAISDGGMGMNVDISGGEPQRSYVVETSPDMRRWLPQEERWIGDGQQMNQFYDSDAKYLGQRYYRLRDRADGEVVMRRVTIQGTVWTDAFRTTPVAGAVVGTTLDGRTAVTDSNGRFFLETDTASSGGTAAYTVIVSGAPGSKSFGPWVWGDQPREQNLEME